MDFLCVVEHPEPGAKKEQTQNVICARFMIVEKRESARGVGERARDSTKI